MNFKYCPIVHALRVHELDFFFFGLPLHLSPASPNIISMTLIMWGNINQQAESLVIIMNVALKANEGRPNGVFYSDCWINMGVE